MFKPLEHLLVKMRTFLDLAKSSTLALVSFGLKNFNLRLLLRNDFFVFSLLFFCRLQLVGLVLKHFILGLQLRNDCFVFILFF